MKTNFPGVEWRINLFDSMPVHLWPMCFLALLGAVALLSFNILDERSDYHTIFRRGAPMWLLAYPSRLVANTSKDVAGTISV